MSLLTPDTDISGHIIKKRPASLVERFEKHAERLWVSVITAAELQSGAEKAGGPVGSVAQLGSSIVEMQDHVTGLQKNIDTLKKVQSALGGK